MRITSCGTSRRASACPSTTCRPGLSITTSRESIETHLSIAVAALAVSHWIQHQTGWSIKKFVRTARNYRTVRIKAGAQILTAADPLPDDLRDALIKIPADGMH
jgi:hypothetical protein